MLTLQFEVSFCSFDLVGAILSDTTAGETWEACEPTFINGIEPCVDWRCTEGHVIEVDEGRDGPDSDAVGSMVGPGVFW